MCCKSTPCSSLNSSSSQESLPFGYDQVFAPWAKRRYPLSIYGLHEELVDVYKWLRPTQIETQIRYQVFDKVATIIRERWTDLEGLRVSVFGSLRTQLFLPSSDIDVLVEYDTTQRESSPEIIKATAEAFSKSREFTKVSTLTYTPVPIIKVVDRDTLISIDISFNTLQGVRAAEYFENVKAEFPTLEPIVFFLKQYLSERNLNYTYSGGLSSYGLILMVQHFLQTNYEQLRYISFDDPRINLGILLLRFLEIFALEFNYADLMIKVKERVYVRKHDEPDRAGYLSIEDPLLAGNDVGRSTYNIQSVRAAFERALTSLKSVFIPDRPLSPNWRSKYRGSMLGHLLTFSPSQIEYRQWLKGFTLKWPKNQEPTISQSEQSLLLAPQLDMTYIHNLLNSLKFPKRIDIVHPDEATSRERMEKDESKEVPASRRDSIKSTLLLEKIKDNNVLGEQQSLETVVMAEPESDTEFVKAENPLLSEENGDGWEDVSRIKNKRAKQKTKNNKAKGNAKAEAWLSSKSYYNHQYQNK